MSQTGFKGSSVRLTVQCHSRALRTRHAKVWRRRLMTVGTCGLPSSGVVLCKDSNVIRQYVSCELVYPWTFSESAVSTDVLV